MRDDKVSLIIKRLETLFPNARCELDHNNNFELLCAVMLSAQTTDKSVNKATKALFARYPSAKELSVAKVEEVRGYIKQLGFSNTKAYRLVELSKILMDKYKGEVPNSLDDLMVLPGVGRKTASVILAEGFNIPAIAVDTHVFRVCKRLGFTKIHDNELKTEECLKKIIPISGWNKANQLLLLFGRYYCKAQNPICQTCIVKEYCKKK